MKLSIKDIFTTPEEIIPTNETKEETVPVNENRMSTLVKAFEEKGEIIKPESDKAVDENKLQQEATRLRQVAKLDEFGSQFMGNVASIITGGQTVNTIADDMMANNQKGIATNNAINNILNNPNSNKLYNPNYTYLQDAEALRLAISRVLSSGSPINNLGFYEEVNQVLNQLGFGAKSALDIKQAVKQLIKD